MLDWLDREFSTESKGEFASDAALIEEARRMVANGMSKRKAAGKVAERAEGAGTLESKIDRLRRRI